MARYLITLCLTIVLLILPIYCRANTEYSKETLDALDSEREGLFLSRLSNGATVAVRRVESPGLVSVVLALRLGSADEGALSGTGIAHLTEHLVFTGTASRPPGRLEEELRSIGATANGATSLDLTTFQITAAPGELLKCLEIAKDLVSQANFPEPQFEREKDVIAREADLYDDEPMRSLDKEVWRTAFTVHPYRYPIIGIPSLLRALTREEVRDFYAAHYTPENIVLAIAGDVDPVSAGRAAREIFADLPSRRGALAATPSEPRQVAERTESAPFETHLAYCALAYPSTDLFDPDMYAADCLALIAGNGESSRLWRALVQRGALAYSVGASNMTPRYRGLFVANAVVKPESLRAFKTALIAELERFTREEVSEDELRGAKRSALARYYLSRQTTVSVAHDLALDLALTGSADYSKRYVLGIERVTQSDILRVARRLITEDGRTFVSLIPKTQMQQDDTRLSNKAREEPIKRAVLSNGLRLLAMRTTKTPMVTVSVACGGGLLRESRAKSGLTRVVSRLLLKGTDRHTEDDILRSIEGKGGSIEPYNGNNGYGFMVTLFSRDLDEVMGLVAEIIARPLFSKEETEREKERAYVLSREQEQDIYESGFVHLRQLLFGEHPYAYRLAGDPAAIRSITHDDVAAYFKRTCVGRNLVVAVAGDIDADQTIARYGPLFSALPAGEVLLPGTFTTAAQPPDRNVGSYELNKLQSLVILGFKSVTLEDPSRYAFDILETVLSGMSGKVFELVRAKHGLAYAAGATQMRGIDPGFFAVFAGTPPKETSRTLADLEAILEAVRRAGVSPDELAWAKKEALIRYRAGLESTGDLSMRIALDELYGLGADDYLRYTAGIDAVTSAEVKAIAQRYLDRSLAYRVIMNPGEKG